MRRDVRTIAAMMRRSANELLRVPGAALPGILAPTVFFVGLGSVFGGLTGLEGFGTSNYLSFLIPVSMLQGAGFTGAAAGVNLARDIEIGLFDRFLASPTPRWALLSGVVLPAAVRAMIPATVLLIVAIAAGADFPGIDGLIVAYGAVMGTAILAACWGATLALRFRTQAAAPLMQSVMLALILSTTAYAPQQLLTGWLSTVAEINPITHVVEAARQGFTGSVSWAGTWPAIVALAGFIVVLGAFALRGMRRTAY